jgi:hypothetical protein
MNTPVSNAIQGAFFVAAFLTGLIFAALAIVFADITDGLGCLLGGFCLSMWFLALKDGGLIASSAGRAIFISCMSVGGYALSWSHYTREYGLIGCISFSGATITVLGIDCFSRAGLKEFWLYLWNLNPDIFPLNTDTYPMTRGIKAELAGIIILTVFGIISQLKAWKLVKEHRTASAAQRLERARDQELEDEERGRTLEATIQKERTQWEATYATSNKNTQDSSEESVATTSVTASSFQEKNSVELTRLSNHGLARSASKATAIVTGIPEDEIEQIDETGTSLPQRPETIHQNSDQSNSTDSARPSSEIMLPGRLSRSISDRSSLRPSARPPPPIVVPLPFRLPLEEDEHSQASENGSMSAFLDSPRDHVINRRSFAKSPGIKRLSASRPSPEQFHSEEALIIPQLEDDQASSVAATIDDHMSTRDISPSTSPLEEHDDHTEAFEAIEINVENREEQDASSPTISGLPPSFTPSTNPKTEESRSKHSSAATFVSGEEGTKGQQPKTTQSSQSGQYDSATGSFEGALPTKFSKVAQTYRVNEWSKYLEGAEKPNVDEIEEAESPGVQIDHERPTPVIEEPVQPLVSPKIIWNRDSNGNDSNGALLRPNLNSARNSQPRLSSSRISSTPLPTVVEPATTTRLSSAPTPTPNNLMNQRETLIRNRTSTQSYFPKASPTNPEDMTLAQRKRVLQQPKRSSSSQNWPKGNRASVSPILTAGFDSHQPKRTTNSGSDQRRETLLAGWRESIRQSTPVQTVAAVNDEQAQRQRRAALLNAKRQAEMEKQQHAQAAQHRESMLQNRMRSGEMLGAHRDAMRRIQAAANKNA